MTRYDMLLLTPDQIDRLLDALGHGREDDPPTATETREWLAWAEAVKRDATLLANALEGRLSVRQREDGWEWRERNAA